MNKCGCIPVQEKIEFPIIDPTNIINPNNNSSSLIEDYNPPCQRDTLCDLKNKIIKDFRKILFQLECGIQPDLEFLLQEISLLYISNDTILFK